MTGEELIKKLQELTEEQRKLKMYYIEPLWGLTEVNDVGIRRARNGEKDKIVITE